MTTYTEEDFRTARLADDTTADRLWVDHITPRLGLGDER